MNLLLNKLTILMVSGGGLSSGIVAINNNFSNSLNIDNSEVETIANKKPTLEIIMVSESSKALCWNNIKETFDVCKAPEYILELRGNRKQGYDVLIGDKKKIENHLKWYYSNPKKNPKLSNWKCTELIMKEDNNLWQTVCERVKNN